MPTLNLKLDASGIKAGAAVAEDGLQDVAAQAHKTESAIDRMVKEVTSGFVKSEKGARSFKATLSGTTAPMNALGASIDGLGGQISAAAKESSLLQQELDDTRAKFDPLFAASKRYEQGLKEIASAEKMGAISSQIASQARDRLATSTIGASNATQVAARSTGLLGRGMKGATGGARGLSMQLSQVVDMGIATGQWGRAFFIQASDIAMLLGGPMTIAAGAAIGVLGTLGLSFIRGGDGAKSLEDGIDDLSRAVSDYSRFADVAGSDTDDLHAKFGILANETSEAAKVLAAWARVDAMREMDRTLNEITESFGGLSRSQNVVLDTSRGFWDSLFDKDPIGYIKEIDNTFLTLRDELELTDGQAKAVVLSLEKLSQADGIEQQSTAAVALNDAFIAAFGSIENIPPELQEIARNASLAALNAGELGKNADGLPSTFSNAASEASRMADEISRALGNMISLKAQGITSFEESSIRLQHKGDPVATSGALARARATERQGVLRDGVGGGELAALDAEVNAIGRRAEATERNRQALIEWQKAQTKASKSGGRAAKSANQQADAFSRLMGQLDPMTAAENKFADSVEILDQALDTGLTNLENYTAAYDKLNEQRKETLATIEAEKSGLNEMASIGGSAIDRLIDGTSSLKAGLKGVLKELVLLIAKKRLLASIDGGSKSDSVGGLIFKGLFGGFFDKGGTLGLGQTGVVGENGPEVVKATSRGAMITGRQKTAQQPTQQAMAARVEVVGGNLTLSDDGKIMAQVQVQSAQARQGAVSDVRRGFGSMQSAQGTFGAMVG